MRVIGRIFLKGLATLVPIVLTTYVIFWFIQSAEKYLGGGLKTLLPEGAYFVGLGTIAAIAVVLAVGLMMHLWLFRWLIALSENLLHRIPVVRSIYGPTRDFMQFLAADDKKDFAKVVMTQFEPLGCNLIGFVTRDDFEGLPEGLGDERTVAVYLPMSYQLGGYTVYLPRDKITPIDLSMEEAMRFTLTAGVSMEKETFRGNKREDPNG